MSQETFIERHVVSSKASVLSTNGVYKEFEKVFGNHTNKMHK